MSNRVIIKRILPLDELEGMVTPQEWIASARFGGEARRCEWLSWRAHLRQSLCAEPYMGVGGDFEIGYRESGAPYIVGSDIYISVSHARTHVAVVVSDKPCAVDIEMRGRNFASVSSRYLSEGEAEIVPLHVGWCLKEAAYKYAAKSGISLLRDIVILSFDGEVAVVKLLGEEVACRVAYLDDLVIATIF